MKINTPEDGTESASYFDVDSLREAIANRDEMPEVFRNAEFLTLPSPFVMKLTLAARVLDAKTKNVQDAFSDLGKEVVANKAALLSILATGMTVSAACRALGIKSKWKKVAIFVVADIARATAMTQADRKIRDAGRKFWTEWEQGDRA
jgi:hypothetical protein